LLLWTVPVGCEWVHSFQRSLTRNRITSSRDKDSYH
jgi:hypothetical protein